MTKMVYARTAADYMSPEEKAEMIGTPKMRGMKHDSGKIKAAILAEFQKALMAVAEVGTFGANKYSRGNWVHVDKAVERYTDAMWRHLLQEGDDPESGLPHFHHFVWNALAVLQLEMDNCELK